MIVVAGLHETEDQVKLIAALDDRSGQTLLTGPVRYLCLQGSASYLWMDIKGKTELCDT